jgi:hypothetical protein
MRPTTRNGRAGAQTERRRTVIFALLICLIVFFSEEAAHKEDLGKRFLRNHSDAKSAFPLSSDKALGVFKNKLNTTSPFEDVLLPNVYLGERGPVEERQLPKNNEVWVFSRSGGQSRASTSSPPTAPQVEDDGSVKVDAEIEDFSLRWNIDKSWRTTLDGVNRVRGVLWTKTSSVIFDGIHFVRENRVTLLTRHPSSDKDDVVLGLATNMPPELRPTTGNSSMSDAGAQAVLKGSFGGSTGLAFGEPAVTEPVHEAPEEAYLFKDCAHPVSIELELLVENKQDGKRMPTSFSGRGMCANSTRSFQVHETRNLMLDVEFAVKSISLMSFFSLVETVRVGQVLSFMGPLRVGVPADLGPLSLGAFGWIALTDMYLCELLMSLSSNVGGQGWWITAALFKGIQFLFIHIPLLVLVFFGRSRLNNESNDQIVRGLSSCMSRAQVAWLVSMFIFEFLRQHHSRLLALMWVSFWVPQIYCTAVMNLSLTAGMKDIITITAFRAVWPLVSLSTTILDTLAAADRYGSHTDAQIYDPEGGLMLIGWIGLQLLIVYLQMVKGPQFFVPRCLLPKRFDYLAGRETLKEGEECVICMQSIAKDEAVITPCQHAFHEKCLEPWLRMKRSCPTCRTSLPMMVI